MSLGAESMHNRILTLMRKGITVELIDRVLRQIGGAMPITLYMIVGFPTETEEEALEGYARVQSYRREGLIQHDKYSMFTLVYGSDIWSHPERYGIRRIVVPDGKDLKPDSFDFEGSGMERLKAVELYDRFNRLAPPSGEFPALILRGRRTELRYGVVRLREALMDVVPSRLYTSFGDLIAACDPARRIRP
jgi:hypothetical protein